MLAHIHGLRARNLFHTVGDAHIYANHMEQVKEYLSRKTIHSSPKLHIESQAKSIIDIKASEIQLVGYEYLPAISAPIAV
ncbi:Thymidylate synthase [compost metagenome]